MNICVISCSTRSGSESRRISNYILTQLSSKNTKADLLDLFDLKLPIYDDTELQGELAQKVADIRAICAQADGFVFVTPEWDGMMSVGLHNFFHYIGHEMAHKPVLPIGVSSGRGGSYPLQQLRTMGYKNRRFVVLPESIVISHCKEVLQSEDHNTNDSWLKERLVYALDVLHVYAEAFVKIRNSHLINLERYPTGM